MKRKKGYTQDRIKEGKRKARHKRKKYGLGYSPAQETASGAGTHGGSRKAQRKRARKKAKEEIKNWQE